MTRVEPRKTEKEIRLEIRKEFLKDALTNAKTEDDVKTIVYNFCNKESIKLNGGKKAKKTLGPEISGWVNFVKSIQNRFKGNFHYHNGYWQHCSIAFFHEFSKNYTGSEPDKTEIKSVEPDKTEIKNVEIDATILISRAIELLESDDWREIGIGLALLTGRRFIEIFETGKFIADSKDLVRFSGVVKTKGKKDTTVFLVPVLADSQIIEMSHEKMKQLLNCNKNYQKLSETETERNRSFHTKFESSVRKVHDEIFRNLLPENFNNFHALRSCYACIIYGCKNKKEQSLLDYSNFLQNVMIHESFNTTKGYGKFIVKNLPELNLEGVEIGETVDEICLVKTVEKLEIDDISLVEQVETVEQIEIEGDYKVNFHKPEIEPLIFEIEQKTEIDSKFQIDLNQISIENLKVLDGLLQSNSLSKVFNELLNVYTNKKQLTEKTTNEKILEIVTLIKKYNLESSNYKLVITSSVINKISKMIFNKEFDFKTLTSCLNNCEVEIEKHYNSIGFKPPLRYKNNLPEYTNTHLKNGKMEQVMTKIKTLYENL